MQNGQGVIAALHVEAGDDAPRAADEIDALAVGFDHGLQGFQGLDDVVLAVLRGALDLLQTEGAKWRGGAFADFAIADAGQFHRVAAEVADHALRLGPAEQDALRRQPCLFSAVNHPEPEAGFAQHLGLKLGAVLGLAGGGGGDDGQGIDGHAAGEQGETLEGDKGAGAALRVEMPGFGQTLAKAAHDFLVVKIGR